MSESEKAEEPEKYSYVPTGLVALTANQPGELCRRCDKIDLDALFVVQNIEEKSGQDSLSRHFLGNVLEIVHKAQHCVLCQLVVEALRSTEYDITSPGVNDQVEIGSFLTGTSVSEEGDRQDTYCVQITLVDQEGSISPSSRGAFLRLLANDAGLIGQKPMHHGRLIGNHVSPELLHRWIERCTREHSFCRQTMDENLGEELVGPRNVRCIDTERMCIHPGHLDSSERITLSYVWGGQQDLQLMKYNQHALSQRGALKAWWDHIPALVQDAIQLVADLNAYAYQNYEGENKYRLWVDQLCIVQDDPKDKAVQIKQMSSLYSWAAACIVVVGGDSSSSNLSRVVPANVDNDPPVRQCIRNIKGKRLLAGLSGVKDAVRASTWNTRAWTFQEFELSTRCIIFGKDQVYWQCPETVCCEDIATEVSDTITKETASKWRSMLNIDRKEAYVNVEDGWSHWLKWEYAYHVYPRLVESYTERQLTFSTDILAAFTGLSYFFHGLTETNWKFCNGMPEDILDLALLWRPRARISRRFRSNGDLKSKPASDELAIPTWAWAAWKGPITYKASPSLTSLIERFNITLTATKSRMISRFSQSDILVYLEANVPQPEAEDWKAIKRDFAGIWRPDVVLEPKWPWMPQDHSAGEAWRRTLGFAKPWLQNTAYRMRLRKEPRSGNVDGPAVLSFSAKSANLVLSEEKVPQQSRENLESQCPRVYVLERKTRRRAGWVWYVDMMDKLRGKVVPIILLSKYPWKDDEERDALFDSSFGEPYAGCLCNAMIIKPLPEGGLSERVTIGKIHEKCADEERQVMLV